MYHKYLNKKIIYFRFLCYHIHTMGNCIKIHGNIFFGPDIHRPQKHIAKLNKGKMLKKSYLVAFCNDSKRIEIFLSYNFLQKTFREQTYTAVAYFEQEAQAFEYIRLLSDISFRKYGCFDAYKTVNELTEEDVFVIRNTFMEGDKS